MSFDGSSFLHPITHAYVDMHLPICQNPQFSNAGKFFLGSLNTYEAWVLQNAARSAINKYLAKDKLWWIPKPSNYNQLISHATMYTFLIKPAATLHMVMSGIPESHLTFCKNQWCYHMAKF